MTAAMSLVARTENTLISRADERSTVDPVDFRPPGKNWRTHLGHERGGIFMLAMAHAAVAARGCSSTVAAAATSVAAASTAVAVMAATDTGSNADVADCMESMSRGCSPLIAPTERVSLTSLSRRRISQFSFPPSLSLCLCLSGCFPLSLFHEFSLSLSLSLSLCLSLCLSLVSDIRANGQKGVLRAR